MGLRFKGTARSWQWDLPLGTPRRLDLESLAITLMGRSIRTLARVEKSLPTYPGSSIGLFRSRWPFSPMARSLWEVSLRIFPPASLNLRSHVSTRTGALMLALATKAGLSRICPISATVHLRLRSSRMARFSPSAKLMTFTTHPLPRIARWCDTTQTAVWIRPLAQRESAWPATTLLPGWLSGATTAMEPTTGALETAGSFQVLMGFTSLAPIQLLSFMTREQYCSS